MRMEKSACVGALERGQDAIVRTIQCVAVSSHGLSAALPFPFPPLRPAIISWRSLISCFKTLDSHPRHHLLNRGQM